jgi:hypothetical protein
LRVWVEAHDEQYRIADNAASQTIATILRRDASVTGMSVSVPETAN